MKSIETSIDPLPGEESVKNNLVTRLVNVDARKPRILYMEGEPRWEFKFLRRAVEDDRTIDLVTDSPDHPKQDLPAGHRKSR